MLIVERFVDGRWNEVVRLVAGDVPATISDTRDGIRHVLHFACKGDRSFIHRLGAGLDMEVGQNRLVPSSLDGAELVATLQPGDSTTLTVRTDKSGSAERILRFRHV